MFISEHEQHLHAVHVLQSLKSGLCSILRALHELWANDELSHLADAYSISAQEFILNSRVVIYDHFANYVNSLT